MKKVLLVLPVMVLGVSAYASALPNEAKECKFRKDKIECKVRIESEGPKLPGEEEKCRKVKLDVDCDCDFDLKDEKATQIEKRKSEIVVGDKEGKIAVVKIEKEDDLAVESDHHDEEDAILVISKKGFTTRFEGKCKNAEY